MSKISVVGAGSVGSTIANDLMVQGIASEIVLIDINKKKAVGEALDIYQGAPFCSPAIVRSGEYPAAEGSDIVVITCGVARKPGMSRLDLAQTNVNILKEVAKNIVQYAPNAVYVIVSNPVDILTYVFTKISGIPEQQIIGSGTILDTSRLQSELAKRFYINPDDVNALFWIVVIVFGIVICVNDVIPSNAYDPIVLTVDSNVTVLIFPLTSYHG